MRRLLVKLFSLVVAAVIFGQCLAFTSAHELRPLHSRTAIQYLPLDQQSVFSDFDGDKLSDVAELSANGHFKNIRVSLSSSPVTYLSFDSEVNDRGRLLSGDINHDNHPDLIWYSPANPRAVVFWINDGSGKFGPPVTSRPSDERDGLDLNAILNQDSETNFAGIELSTDSVIAVRSADSSELRLENRQPLPAFSSTAIQEKRVTRLSAAFLEAIRKRGPPAQLL